jgi:hypothetical protein
VAETNSTTAELPCKTFMFDLNVQGVGEEGTKPVGWDSNVYFVTLSVVEKEKISFGLVPFVPSAFHFLFPRVGSIIPQSVIRPKIKKLATSRFLGKNDA